MPTQYLITRFGGEVSPRSWSQVIETPGGIAIVEINNTDHAQEKGLAYSQQLNEFLQQSPNLHALRLLLSSITDSSVVSLILIIPTEQDVLLAIKGYGFIMLGRNNKWVPLMKGAGVLKGSTKPDDTLVVWTPNAKIITEKFYQLITISHSPQTISDTLTTLLIEEKQTGVGIVIKYVTQQFEMPRPKTLPSSSKVLHSLKKLPKTVQYAFSSPQTRIKIAAVMLGIGFIISVVLGIYRQKNNEEYNRLEQSYNQAQQYLTEGIALMDSQPDESRQKFTQANSIIEEAISRGIPKSKTGKKLLELKPQIQDNLRIASKIFPVTLTEYFDASFLRTDRSITAMSLSEDTLFFVDSAQGFVGGIELTTKNADVLSGDPSLIGTKGIASQEEELFLLATDTIYRIVPKSETPSVIDISMEGVQSKDGIAAFGSNIYILDKSSRQLWRYTKNNNEYKDKEPYFQPEINPDLSSVTNISIDGSVWFGTTQGKVYKYSQGRDDPFVARGLDPSLGQEVYVYTTNELNYVYILDVANKRIVMLTKDGKYLAQYEWESEGIPNGFVVSENQKRVIVLQDQKMYSFALQ